MQLSNAIAAWVTVAFIAIGGVFTLWQWSRANLLKRADYINDLLEKIRTDDDIKKTLASFDYDKSWYNLEFHGSGKSESKVDKTLSCFSYICYLKKMKIISEKEFTFFKYNTTTILQNTQVQDYFYNLYHLPKRHNTFSSFEYLFDYAKSEKFFDDDFYDKDSYKTNDKYHNYLSF